MQKLLSIVSGWQKLHLIEKLQLVASSIKKKHIRNKWRCILDKCLEEYYKSGIKDFNASDQKINLNSAYISKDYNLEVNGTNEKTRYELGKKWSKAGHSQNYIYNDYLRADEGQNIIPINHKNYLLSSKSHQSSSNSYQIAIAPDNNYCSYYTYQYPMLVSAQQQAQLYYQYIKHSQHFKPGLQKNCAKII